MIRRVIESTAFLRAHVLNKHTSARSALFAGLLAVPGYELAVLHDQVYEKGIAGAARFWVERHGADLDAGHILEFGQRRFDPLASGAADLDGFGDQDNGVVGMHG